MQAADFLRDAETAAAMESRLLLAILGFYADGQYNMRPPPSAAECARAYRVRPPVPALLAWMAAVSLCMHAQTCLLALPARGCLASPTSPNTNRMYMERDTIAYAVHQKPMPAQAPSPMRHHVCDLPPE